MYEELSKIYDFIHKEKNYVSEVDYLKRCINKHSDFSKVNSILDFGCGTCSHLSYLIEGKQATGIDLSPEMIKKAQEKKIKNLELYAGNIREFKTNKSFDLCISMFHVFNHFDCIAELGYTFDKISSLLSPGSLFIFDSLNAVAVFRNKPEDRSFEKTIDNRKYLYTSKCSMDFMNSQFTMFNEIIVEEDLYKYSLTQNLWTPGTFRGLLNKSGFEVLSIYKNFTTEAAAIDDYKICFIARKK